jgi:hypothetical protein
MKVLVIPDVHLKPWMFEQAGELMSQESAEKAVCLMDIADDWRQQWNLDLYIQTYEAAIAFAKKLPETLWCYGNHDVCYLWNQRETGYSLIAPWTVNEKLRNLRESLPNENQLAFIHRIDDVLFMHGGLTQLFVDMNVSKEAQADTDKIIEEINRFGVAEMWDDISPIWYRPQYSHLEMYKDHQFLQVVGHTPVESIQKDGNVISCDVFSTDQNKKPIGSQEFLLIDTKNWTYQGINCK